MIIFQKNFTNCFLMIVLIYLVQSDDTSLMDGISSLLATENK